MTHSIEDDAMSVLEALVSRTSSTAQDLLSRTGLTEERLGAATELLEQRGHVRLTRAATAKLFLIAEITSAGRLAVEQRPAAVERWIKREKVRRGFFWALILAVITLVVAILRVVLKRG